MSLAGPRPFHHHPPCPYVLVVASVNTYRIYLYLAQWVGAVAVLTVLGAYLADWLDKRFPFDSRGKNDWWNK